MDERVQDRAETLPVVAEGLHGDLASNPEGTFDAGNAESVDNVLCKPEWHTLGCLKLLALVEQAVEIDVDSIARARVQENVLAVSITKTSTGVRRGKRERTSVQRTQG